MPMTIRAFSNELGTVSREEIASMQTSRARDIWRWIGWALLALGLWFSGLIALTVAAEPTQSVIVFAPDRERMISAISSSNVALLDGSVRTLRVTGASPGFVAKLYASGASLVLPARTGTGCLIPPPAAAARSRARG